MPGIHYKSLTNVYSIIQIHVNSPYLINIPIDEFLNNDQLQPTIAYASKMVAVVCGVSDITRNNLKFSL